ncbi:MAG: hypothetical protein H6726_11320 [Sandaracinaceae bacterium]|nr:hypothetical protein [Sandaracinaceae bacterium]
MSTIVLRAQVDPSASLLGALRRVTGTALGELRSSLMDGAPIVSEAIFGNDHDEVSLVLLGVADVFEDAGVDYEIFELGEGETFESAPLDRREISLSTLKNILTT